MLAGFGLSCGEVFLLLAACASTSNLMSLLKSSLEFRRFSCPHVAGAAIDASPFRRFSCPHVAGAAVDASPFRRFSCPHVAGAAVLMSSVFARAFEVVLPSAMVWWADEVLRYSSANSTRFGLLLLKPLSCISLSLFAFSLCLIRSNLAGSHRSTGALDLIGFNVKFLAKMAFAFGPLRLRMD